MSKNESSEQRLKLLDKYYGLMKSASVVDASGDNIKALFRQRRILIQDRIDAIARALDVAVTSAELFDPRALDTVMSPEVELVISNPLADLPRP